MENVGIYFLGNNSVFDLVMAFLNSIKASNRDLALCFIPYNSECDQVLQLAPQYNFDVFTDINILDRCDELGKRFIATGCGQFRKLAAWHGKFDKFIYIDVDTIVLKDLGFVFSLLNKFDLLTSHSNLEGGVKWVWKPSIWEDKALSTEQIKYAASTGFIASRRNSISLEYAESCLPDALEVLPHMELLCAEQPFLNFLIVTSSINYSSLSTIKIQTQDPRIFVERWAGTKGGQVSGKTITFPGLPPTLLLHWAGEWKPGKYEALLKRIVLALGIRVPHPQVRVFMRYKRLWKHYYSHFE